MENAEKKLHVDEDWKEQVEREKRDAKANAGTPARGADERAGAETAATSADEVARRHAAKTTGQEQPFGEPAGASGKGETPAYSLPPATLAFLVTTIGTQAMVALGELPSPLTGKVERQLPQAKHFIDTLTMLEEKTQGNRTPEESAILGNLLHQLRMAYVMESAPKS